MYKLFLNQIISKKLQEIELDFFKYIYTSLLQNLLIINWEKK